MKLVNVLDHIAVTVSDLNRSLAFYRDTLGLQEVERHHLDGPVISKMAAKKDVVLDVVRLASPDTPTVLLDLQQYANPIGKTSTATLGDPAHAHFCFGVPDVWAAYRDLSAKGVEFISEPVTFELESGTLHVVWCKDPDGFIIEFVTSPIDPPKHKHE